VSASRIYHLLRDNLGSIRKVYGGPNQVHQHGDLGEKGKEHVLLLHGFMQTRNVWEVMEDRLRFDGYAVFSFNLGGLFRRFNTVPVSAMAESLAEKIEGLCERTGLERFHIVGHSKGGILARQLVQHHGCDRRVKSLITLGTPHHGTPTAAFGVWITGLGLVSRSPFELLPRSKLIRGLGRDTSPAQIPLTSIYSRHDLVCPFWCSTLFPRTGETSMQNRPIRNVGHTALCYDPGVYTLVRTELQKASALWEERSTGIRSLPQVRDSLRT
jgi:triacylglycerol esterase/lipase EstA (alpha/beta hydrolase family)